MLEGQVVLGAVQCRKGAQDLRDVRHCIVSPYALVACDVLILEVSATPDQSSSNSISRLRIVNNPRVKRVETSMLCNT